LWRCNNFVSSSLRRLRYFFFLKVFQVNFQINACYSIRIKSWNNEHIKGQTRADRFSKLSVCKKETPLLCLFIPGCL
jgi:hypothetical protein